jgi:hypothetical protein
MLAFRFLDEEDEVGEGISSPLEYDRYEDTDMAELWVSLAKFSATAEHSGMLKEG